MTTHVDEARRIVDEWPNLNMECDIEELTASIAAALAAAERAGWIAGRDAAAAVVLERQRNLIALRASAAKLPDHGKEWQAIGREAYGCGIIAEDIRALLPAAVAEPAAKCATCGQYPSRGWVPADRADGWVPCPARAAGGGS